MSITLELKAKHFEDADYTDNLNCPVARAYKDLTGNPVSEGVNNLTDLSNLKNYSHEEYYEQYDDDYKLAASHKFDGTVVRTLELLEYEEEIS